MTKAGREIVEIFEAFDLTGTAWSAAQLAGCDAKTIARYVAVREAGGDPLAKTARPQLIDGFMDKVVPKLQDRGVYPAEYVGATLRDHLALPLLRSLATASRWAS